MHVCVYLDSFMSVYVYVYTRLVQAVGGRTPATAQRQRRASKNKKHRARAGGAVGPVPARVKVEDLRVKEGLRRLADSCNVIGEHREGGGGGGGGSYLSIDNPSTADLHAKRGSPVCYNMCAACMRSHSLTVVNILFAFKKFPLRLRLLPVSAIA